MTLVDRSLLLSENIQLSQLCKSKHGHSAAETKVKSQKGESLSLGDRGQNTLAALEIWLSAALGTLFGARSVFCERSDEHI